MMSGPVKVWRQRHKEINSYLTGGALILGEPDEVFQPQSMIGRPEMTVMQPSLGQQTRKKLGKVGGGKKARITREKYLEYRKKGLSKDQICERVDIARKSLSTLIKKWELNSPELERNALGRLRDAK